MGQTTLSCPGWGLKDSSHDDCAERYEEQGSVVVVVTLPTSRWLAGSTPTTIDPVWHVGPKILHACVSSYGTTKEKLDGSRPEIKEVLDAKDVFIPVGIAPPLELARRHRSMVSVAVLYVVHQLSNKTDREKHSERQHETEGRLQRLQRRLFPCCFPPTFTQRGERHKKR